MGKFKKNKGSKKDRTGEGTANDKGADLKDVPQASRGDWKSIETKNEHFDKYYKSQNILPEAEWEPFMESLRADLPTTFRFTGSRSTAQDINEHMKSTYVPYLSNVELDGVKQPIPTQLPWYPEGLGWQVNVGKQIIRKSPEYKKLQQFLVYETDVGNLSRQEAVSMIPPLLLEVQPDHYVLDMCAAPGSKTAQILEALHTTPPSTSPATINIPKGLVVANDSDQKRAHLLVHQSSRLPSANVCITNLDASRFPKISLGPEGQAKFGMKNLLFDRILCDVPCSGDGTMRKNANIWAKWSVGDGNGLHSLQLRILLRAMDLLKPGGRLVYSTCSFNPVENEAVVSAALNRNSSFKIVDVSSKLSALTRRGGLTTWKAGVGRDTDIYDTYDEFYASPKSTATMKEKIPKTFWPAGNGKEQGLEKCLRMYPQDNDTGGFFVTVLEKTIDTSESSTPTNEKEQRIAPEPTTEATVDSIIPTEPGTAGAPSDEPLESIENPLSSTTSSKRPNPPSPRATSPDPEPSSKKPRQDLSSTAASSSSSTPKPEATHEIRTNASKPDPSFKEDPYFFLGEDRDEVKVAVDFFGLKPDFKTTHLYTRNENEGTVRSVYYASDLVKTIIQNNDFTRLRLISAGVKLFARQDTPGEDVPCKWRATAEGLGVLLPYVEEAKVVKGTVRDMKILLESHYPLISRFDGELQKTFANAPIGSIIFEISPGEVEGGSLRSGLTVPLWKAKNSMSMMIAKKEKTALSNRIWGKDLVGPTPYGGNVHSKPPIAASAVSAEAAVPVEEKAEEAEGIEEAVMEETGAPDKAI